MNPNEPDRNLVCGESGDEDSFADEKIFFSAL